MPVSSDPDEAAVAAPDSPIDPSGVVDEGRSGPQQALMPAV
ncbi:hypothetical protein ACQBAR_08815 [Propionibacteriaceae bacterium Y1685]